MIHSRQKTKYLIFIAGGSITLLVLSCFLGLTIEQDRMINNSIELSARRLFECIVLTRRWNASYGGVFVLKTKDVQSNSYLDHPDILSASGLTYTLKNPALMTREISELAEKSGNYQYHITSLNLLNPNNKPDPWEEQSLKAFENGESERTEITEKDGKKIYRLMRPLVVEDGCLQCHAKQGYTTGDVRGGISVSLPFDQIADALTVNRIRMAALALTIVIVFSCLFYFIIWRLITRIFNINSELNNQKKYLEELTSNLDKEVGERTSALLESEKRFRSTFEQAPIGICHAELGGRFIRLNHRFSTIVGYSEADLKTRPFQDVFSDQELSSSSQQWEKILLGDQKAFSIETKYLRQDNTETWVNLTISLIRKDNGAPYYYICILEDFSDRKKLERQLQQAQKLEALGTLAGGIAHDFNNILTPILGYTEMSLIEIKPEDEKFEYMQEVFTAACRAKELTRQILTFSRQDNFEQKPLDIIVIIKEVFKLLRSSIPTTIEMPMHLEPKECIILANPTQIHQILMNLCTNAAHAMGNDTGILCVKLTEIKISPGDSKFLLAPGRYASLEISDTGCGMNQATIDRIYDPYFTTKKKGEGTGLGLAMVHGIVERLKGMISVYSEINQGTTFRIFLPVLEKGKERIQDIEDNTEIKGGTERILLVDDEAVITSMQNAMLSELGYTVTTENDSLAALQLFRESPDSFDLVITDMTMPQLTGIMLITEMQAIRPDLPVILCTGYSAEFTSETIKGSRIFALLTKPVFKDMFCRTVRKALDSRALKS